ncbi:MAG: hypothetical protein GWN87_27575, partial [Desulfuromonadales bacterium]|nr:hypothetical protein [Desulfuromonadales bacterium]
GYEATTGGDGENRAGEDPTLISRCHAGAGAFGWPQATLDNIAFRANVRLFQGNHYWGLFVLSLNVWRRLLRAVGLSPETEGSPA